MISGERVFTVTLRAALRRNAQLQHLAVRAERKRLERKQLILAADPVNRALDLLCRSVQRRLARRQQQPAVFWNALEELHLFLRDAFTVAERRNMGQADIGENAVVRPRNLFQRGHFSRSRNADFKNGQRLRLLRRKHRQRKTKLAVVTSGRSQHLPARKQRLQSVFNDCLAVAAGDRQHALKIFTPCQRARACSPRSGSGTTITGHAGSSAAPAARSCASFSFSTKAALAPLRNASARKR